MSRDARKERIPQTRLPEDWAPREADRELLYQDYCRSGITPGSEDALLVSLVVAFMGRARRPALGDAGPTDCSVGEVTAEADQRDQRARNIRAS
jgi:hypothetical protein